MKPSAFVSQCVVTGLLLGVLGGLPATAADEARDDEAALLREVRDRQQLEELMWRYARSLDGLDAATYAALYTEDGEFVSPAGSTKGRTALRDYVAGVARSRDERRAKGENPTGTLHMVTNHIITFKDRDHATIDAYWITMFPAGGAETPVRVGGAGRSIDEVVRVNGQWLIKVRDVAPK
ncbi:MAG: nuclear transport factor 2 family protein [Gammaproteobacteria bacterium]|nr:nuclear transport factor 2 family protein [Gammaproteobacteria bacterium]